MLLWMLTVLVAIVVLFLLFALLLHRPLPDGIADCKKIHLLEFAMRTFNEYIGNLVELFAGPVARNKFTRLLACIPFWVFQRWRPPPKWCVIRRERIAGIRCRMYLPTEECRRSNAAALVYIHGGGWSMGRAEFYDGAMLHIIKKLGLHCVISINYTLSPEVQFPCALQECEKVLEELKRKKFGELGVDSSKVALMGDSAGGNICTVLCQRAMRKLRSGNVDGVLMPKCQVLVYPVIHMLDFQSPSYQFYYRTYPGTGLLNPKLLIRWYLFYLGIEPTRENIRAVAKNEHLSSELLADKELMRLVDRAQLPPKFQEEQQEHHHHHQTMGKDAPMMMKTHQKCILLNGICCRQNNNNKIADANGNVVVNNGRQQQQQQPANKQQKHAELAARMTQLLRNPDICPLVADDLHGLCPALICTAGIDILRDEGILYAQRLKQFNVPVEWKHYDAAYHGILNMGKSAQRERILDDVCDYLRRNLL